MEKGFSRKSDSHTKETRRANPGLRAALALMGVLQGSQDGAADTHGWSTELKLPQKKIEYVIPKATENIPYTAEYVKEMLIRVQESLRPGGVFYKELNDENLTEERLEPILKSLSHVTALFEMIRAKVIDPGPEFKKYLTSARFPGQRQLQIKYKDGKTGQCNAAYVHYSGQTYLVTAQHCIANAVDEDSYEYLPQELGVDVAIKAISKKDEPRDVMAYDAKITDEMLNGQVMVMNAADHSGTRVDYLSVVVQMTRPVARIFSKQNTSNATKRAIQSGFWHVAPPEQGMSLDNGKSYNFQGQSGNLNFTFVPSYGGYVIGGIFHHGRGRSQACTIDSSGLCNTIGISESPKVLQVLFDQHQLFNTAKRQEALLTGSASRKKP